MVVGHRDRGRIRGLSAGGRAASSALIVALLALVVAVNLPPSRLREVILVAGDPVLRATGLDQNWRIFAPDPRDRSLAVDARIDYSDGDTTDWELPSGGPILGVYWDYRWRKWVEHVVDPEKGPRLQRAAALYIARRAATPERMPVRVTLRRLERPVLGPQTPDGMRMPAWRASPLHQAEFSAARARE